MTNEFERKPELDALIQAYKLEVVGGKVGTRHCPQAKVQQMRKDVTPHKDELMAYISALKAWEQVEDARKTANFEHIPGLQELRAARAAHQASRAKFRAAVERGDSVFDPLDDGSQVAALEAQYPDAVFALDMWDKRYSANYELAAIAQRAYDRLREGEAPQAVKADYDADNHAFAQKHLWD